jgi:hypothetical protein
MARLSGNGRGVWQRDEYSDGSLHDNETRAGELVEYARTRWNEQPLVHGYNRGDD